MGDETIIIDRKGKSSSHLKNVKLKFEHKLSGDEFTFIYKV